MATETTKTDKTEETGAAPETEREKVTAVGTTEPQDVVEAQDDHPGAADDELDTETSRGTGVLGGGFGAGAAAVVSAGLGLCSLTGTSLSEMLRERKQMIGQIEASAQPPSGGGGGGDQISALYGAPWHASALLNGVFALLAVVVGGVLLALVAKRAETRSWVKAVALGGLILGAIGLLVAGGMYFDLFAGPPKVPGQPS